MNTHRCPICQAPVSGRTDKKYCSDQCRALANNKKKIETQHTLLVTNQALRKNRTILKTLCPQGKATVRKEVLISMGFSLDYFISIFVTRSKQVYYLCYDYGYTPIMEGQTEKALLVSRQDYMKDWNPWKFLNKG
jgi:predicted nucleic acid-binding Zn ribbon protein